MDHAKLVLIFAILVEFETQVQINVLYKKASQTIIVHHVGFFANLHKMKNGKVEYSFWILTLSTSNFLQSLEGGIIIHISIINYQD